MGSGILMRPLEAGLAVPAGAKLTLQPRGYHLLMTGLKTPLVRGAKLPVALVFERTGTIQTELTVDAPGPVGSETLLKAS